VTEVRGESVKGGGVRLTEAEKDFLGRGGELTEVVEAGRLIHDKVRGKQLPKRVA
jgi:hypothetical protein